MDTLFDRFRNIVRANVNDYLHQLDFFRDQDASSDTYHSYEQDSQEPNNYNSNTQQQKQYYQQRPRNPKTTQSKEEEYMGWLELPLDKKPTFQEIKKAYRKQIKLYHPDLYKEPEKKKAAEDISEKLNEAYNFFKTQYGTH